MAEHSVVGLVELLKLSGFGTACGSVYEPDASAWRLIGVHQPQGVSLRFSRIRGDSHSKPGMLASRPLNGRTEVTAENPTTECSATNWPTCDGQ